MLPAPGPLSACGRVVDYLRSAYRTRMRFGDDPESERSVRWQFVPEGTPVLDRPTVFGSIQWGAREPTSGPGEVVGAPRSYDRGVPLPWPYGAGPCGTDQQWAEGFGSGSLPELPLGPDGVPLCCGSMPPVPVVVCPDGMPAAMFGQVECGTFGGPPAFIHFAINHVPSSSPPKWMGTWNWADIGGTGFNLVEWFPTGPPVIELMTLRLTGCDASTAPGSQNIFTPNCGDAEWVYFGSGGAGCAPGISLSRAYRIRATPFT